MFKREATQAQSELLGSAQHPMHQSTTSTRQHPKQKSCAYTFRPSTLREPTRSTWGPGERVLNSPGFPAVTFSQRKQGWKLMKPQLALMASRDSSRERESCILVTKHIIRIPSCDDFSTRMRGLILRSSRIQFRLKRKRKGEKKFRFTVARLDQYSYGCCFDGYTPRWLNY